MKPSVFLTGASGFLGRHILDGALAEGAAVSALVRGGALDPLAEAHPALTLVRGDLGEPGRYAGFLGGQVVLHAAATAPAWGSYALCRARSAELTRGLVDACVQQGAARLVMLSATDVYGAVLEGVVTEEHPVAARGELCGDTHLDAEGIALEAHRAGALEVVILRAALCYGRHDRTFLPRLAQDLLRGACAIIGDGTARPLLCDATRLAACAWAAATAPAAAAGQVYNVADADSRLNWGELLTQVNADLRSPFAIKRVPGWVAGLACAASESLGHLVGSREAPRLTRHVFEIFTARHRLSVAKAIERLGWTPRADAASGLLEHVEWFAPILRGNRGVA